MNIKKNKRSDIKILILTQDPNSLSDFKTQLLGICSEVNTVQFDKFEKKLVGIEKQDPSILIIDSKSPSNKLQSLIQNLKKSDSFQKKPLLIITYDNTLSTLKENLYDLGVTDFLDYQIDFIELKIRIENSYKNYINQLDLIEKNDKINNIYDKYFENTNSAVSFHEMIFDEKGKPIDYLFLNVNSAFEKITTLKEKDIIGKTILEIMPNIEYVWIKKYGEVVKTGKSILFEDYNQQLDKYFQVKAFKTIGNKFGLNVTDITEYRKILDNMKILTAAMEQSPVSIIITDLEANIEFVNPKFCSLTGYTHEEVIGKNPRVLKGDNLSKHDYKNLWNEILSGRIWKGEFLNKKKNGELYWENATISPIHDSSGKITHFLAIKEDVTDHKLAEKNIDEQARLLDLIFKYSLDSIVLLDKDYNFIRVSETYAKACDRDSDEFYGNNHFDFYPSDLKDEFDIVKKEKSIYQRNERPFIFPDHPEWGVSYWNLGLVPIFDDKGEIEFFLFSLKDVTGLKNDKENKERLGKQLRHKQKLETIGTLASGIAHDFNNILTPIMGYTDLAMLDLDESDQLYSDLSHVLNGAKKAKNLIEQILFFGKRSEKGKQSVKFQFLLSEALNLLRPIIPSTISINQNIDDQCGNVIVDSTQIHQVIVNLLTNAWQSMENKKGSITVKLSQTILDKKMIKLLPFIREGKYAILSIKDEGDGMHEEVLGRIFDPFFTTKTTEKGTGLGLFVVHNIIRNHDGDIIVKSKVGKGTTFEIYLPIIDLEGNNIKSESKKIIGGNERILVVDDDIDILDVLDKTLSKFGYNVDTFDNALDALSSIQSDSIDYDLVISDLTMPNMTGLEFADELNLNCPKLPIILMTGFIDLIKDNTSEKKNIKKVITKPISLDYLSKEIRIIFDKM